MNKRYDQQLVVAQREEEHVGETPQEVNTSCPGMTYEGTDDPGILHPEAFFLTPSSPQILKSLFHIFLTELALSTAPKSQSAGPVHKTSHHKPRRLRDCEIVDLGQADKAPGDRPSGRVPDDHATIVDTGGYGLCGLRPAEGDDLSIDGANKAARDFRLVDVVAGDGSLAIDSDGRGIHIENPRGAEIWEA